MQRAINASLSYRDIAAAASQPTVIKARVAQHSSNCSRLSNSCKKSSKKLTATVKISRRDTAHKVNIRGSSGWKIIFSFDSVVCLCILMQLVGFLPLSFEYNATNRCLCV